MRDLKTVSEKQLLGYAMKGLCERILKAPDNELDRLNEQYDEMYRRLLVINDIDKPPWDSDGINVTVKDDYTIVSCESGDYNFDSVDKAWRWVIGAVSFPSDYTIKVIDRRENRQYLAT